VTGQELPFDQPLFWFVQLVIFSLLIPAFILFRQIATANLTFEGANRSTGIRISCAVLLTVSLAWLLLFTTPGLLPGSLRLASSTAAADVVVFATPLAIWLWLIGLFTATEDDRLSRRVRQEVPRHFLVRLFVLPFYPGGGRGFLYFLISVLLFTVVTGYLTFVATGSPDEKMRSQLVIIAIASYLLFYIGITSFLGRGLRKIGTDLHAAHARVLGILVASTGIIGPFLFVFWDYRFSQTVPSLMITNPFYACYKLVYEADTAPPLAGILLLGAIGVTLNVKNLILSVREFLTAGSDVTASATTPSA